MTLHILQTNQTQPYGQFDWYDGSTLDIEDITGGQIVTLVGNQDPGELSVSDVESSFLFGGLRPRVTTGALDGTELHLYIADEGNTSTVGTLGGAVAGQVTNHPLAPGLMHSTLGSGKVTLWRSKGLYAVSLNAADDNADGMTLYNPALTMNANLTYTAEGKITPVGSTDALVGAPVIGTFMQFDGEAGIAQKAAKVRTGMMTAEQLYDRFIFNWTL